MYINTHVIILMSNYRLLFYSHRDRNVQYFEWASLFSVKVWKQPLSKSVFKSVYVCVRIRIGECQVSAVKIQMNSDPVELLLYLENSTLIRI